MEPTQIANPLDRPAGAPAIIPRRQTGSFDTLGQDDFLTLMIAQLQQQDPFEPVDNKDMLAQMAQFSSLAGSTEGNATLEQIVQRLDTLIDAQTPAPAIPSPAPSATEEQPSQDNANDPLTA